MNGAASPAVATVESPVRSRIVSGGVDQVMVGRDILELVSSAMYVEPLTIYREYLQNAADAIDDARASGLLGEDAPGHVHIQLDPTPQVRSIRIRDNGAGLPWERFTSTLTALGASVKRGTAARGFRGVGRLAGLGFAQELIFRARAKGEALVSELRWDCRRLKAALRDNGQDEGVQALIRDIVTVSQVPPDGHPDHFFEVELRGVLRQGADRLMSAHAVADYIGEIGPVSFAPEFRFGAEIVAALGRAVSSRPMEVYVGEVGPIYRPHRDAIPVEGGRSIVFDEPVFVEVPGADGGVAALAWFLHHDYEGALPNATMVKGLRLRSGNIQIGDHSLLEGLFPEPRFNVWSVGEVHVLDRRLIPNGRRDNLEQNVHFSNLLNHLAPVAKDIARRCRTSSAKRKWFREFEVQSEVAREKLGVLSQGGLNGAARDALALGIEQSLLRMEKIVGTKMLLPEEGNELRPRIEELRTEIQSAMAESGDASPLSRLPPEQRDMYENFFSLIYECSTNRSAAKALVDRILLKIA